MKRTPVAYLSKGKMDSADKVEKFIRDYADLCLQYNLTCDYVDRLQGHYVRRFDADTLKSILAAGLDMDVL